MSDPAVPSPSALPLPGGMPLPGVPGPRRVAESADGYGGRNVAAYGVGQIAAYLRELLETDPVVGDLWVAGEITNLSRSQAGHLYFTLTDKEGALRCVFFRRENLGVAVEQGDQVLIHGRISLYAERGDLQLYVDALQPEGVGVLHAEYQRLLADLEREGLFESARKRPLPRYPRRIGVVTSPAGAVWHDIQSVAARRWPLTTLLLAPCRVQGDGAARTIVAAIEALNRARPGSEIEGNGEAEGEDDAGTAVDVIVVARGGGSIEDLWPFNEEIVARAIFASTIPVVSAVGHETDYTIADYVADLRAPTPSAAAELLLPDQAEERANIAYLRSALGRALESTALTARGELAQLVDRLEAHKPDMAAERLRIDDLMRRAVDVVRLRIGQGRTALARAEGRLVALDPSATLARGYAIVHDARGRPLRSVAALSPGDRVGIRLSDGRIDADVTSVARD